MARIVRCAVLKREAEGLERPPHPGPLGQRIFENVSQEGWKQWLQRLATILNENKLSTADPGSIKALERILSDVDAIRKRVKDLHVAEPGGHDVPFGTGVSDVTGILDEYKAQGFDGPISVEYEYKQNDNLTEVKQCIDFVRAYGTKK